MKITRSKLSFSNALPGAGPPHDPGDTGMPGEERRILRAAEQAGVKAGDIHLILHTHGHVDHTGHGRSLARDAVTKAFATQA